MSVDIFLHRLFGRSPFPDRGIVQLSAVTLQRGELRVLKIQEDTPRSRIDFFLLQSARAWADAIVTSGAIFRAEPGLRYAFQGNVEEIASLRDFRANGGRHAMPTLAILTSGGSFPADHPALGDVRPLFYSTPAGRDGLLQALPHAEILADTEASPRRLVAALRERGLERILIELGPTSAKALLQPPVLVDRLTLSRFEGGGAQGATPQWMGAALVDEDDLPRRFERRSRRAVSERSGPWCFELWAARQRRAERRALTK